MKTLLQLSKDVQALNPHLSPTPANQNSLAGRVRTRVGLRIGMNKTESEFALILEDKKRNGEILRWEFEGVTLRFANVKYTPDFVVFSLGESKGSGTQFYKPMEVKFIEVKGAFIRGNRERAVERFRHAKTYWPEFTFEMHQKTKDGWKQIL